MSGSRRRAMAHQLDLGVAALVVLLAVGAVAAGLPPLVRLVVAVPIVLFVPGFALVSALLPTLVIPAVERLLLAVGSSIALSILIGLAIGLSGIILDAVSWSVALAGVSLTLLAIAWLRRVRRGQSGPRLAFAGMPRRGAVMVIVASLIVADVLLGVRLVAEDRQVAAPAQLWLVPDAAQTDTARLGVRAGPDGGRYVVALSVSGEIIHRFELNLASEETWETIVVLSSEVRARPVVARLFEGDATAELRFVVLQPATDGG